IKRGLYLLRFTPESLPAYATSNLRCTSCHQDDGLDPKAAPLTGSHARFPKYMGRSGTVIALADRVNYCFTRSLAGSRLANNSKEMTDIVNYLAYLSKGIPVGTKAKVDGLLGMPNKLTGDPSRGEAIFK
ncbi:MAG: c-type cytochrome, partial [Phycisphaerae bacterium]